MPSTRVKPEGLEVDEKRERDAIYLTENIEYDDFIKINIPEEIIFPEELNRFLREQIRELTAENGCLRRSLEESEEKFLKLCKINSRTETTPPKANGLRSSEIAASKIVELSKKCRDQRAEIEGLKSRCKTLGYKLSENKKTEEIKACPDSGDGIINKQLFNKIKGINFGPSTIDDELKNREEEIKQLRDKIQQVNSKLYESKNTCTSLRREIKKIQKLLFREVGDNVAVASLTSYKTGWRGRAEQIKQLQNKLTEYEGTISKGSIATISDKRNVNNLRKIEKERREKAEESSRELCRTIVALENYKRKNEAAKARVKVLENDLNRTKQSVELLNEKRSHDEQLIQALNGQLKAVEEKFRDREKEILCIKDRAENECVKICSESNGLKSSIDNYRRIIEEREKEIDSLRSGTGISLARENRSKINSPLSRGSNGDCNEYVTLGLAAEAERERLIELVVVLNRRLEEERFAGDKTGEILRAERSKLARLETKLQKLEIEKVGMSKVNTGYKPRYSKSTMLSVSGTEGNGAVKDETRFRLELLEEECIALKTRLATVQRDKSSDLAVYKQMLDQARKTFQEAYRSKPSSCCYSTVTI